jgi:hypothetical protein
VEETAYPTIASIKQHTGYYFFNLQKSSLRYIEDPRAGGMLSLVDHANEVRNRLLYNPLHYSSDYDRAEALWDVWVSVWCAYQILEYLDRLSANGQEPPKL